MKTMRVRLTFVDELLGTAASQADIHEKFIASKAPDAPSREEEVAAIGTDAAIENGRTIFSRDEDGDPCLWGYQIKGFFKAACSAYKRDKSKSNKTKSKKLTAHKKKIDQNVFVFADANDKAGRKIKIHYDGEIGSCQRPLRAQTAQGERIAIADSESINAGAYVEFDVLFADDLEDCIKEWLDYGILNGLGQWRNAGKGAFTWEEVK